MPEPIYIDRPPRIQPELPIEEIEIPAPPQKEESGYARLIQMSLPMLTIIGYVLIGTLGGGGRNPLFLIPMALSVVASVAFSIYSYRKEKQRQLEIEKGYAERLVELNKEMNNYHDMQRRFYRYNYPDNLTSFRLVENTKEEVAKSKNALRTEARLWERRVSDDDFGAVRLGMGTLSSTVTYTLQNIESFEDPQARESMKLEQDSRYVSDIPVIISLRQPQQQESSEEDEDSEEDEIRTSRIPVTHALGIAGERHAVYEFVRAMLGHFVIFHAPMDARLHILASRKQEWSWTDNLPHSQDDEQAKFRYFAEESAEKEKKGGDDEEEGALEQFLEGIRKVLAQRKIQMQEHGDEEKGTVDPTHPFLLVVVDLLDETFTPDSPLNDLESDAAISILLEEGATLGAAVLFLVTGRSKVPSGCTAVLEIERTTPATNSKIEQVQKLHFRYAEVGVNSFRYVGEADYVTKPEQMVNLTKQLAQLRIHENFGANLPNAVPFFSLMGYKSLQDLEEDTWRKWQNSIQYANWLKVKVGLMSGNKPRTLAFSAKRDGVHGMVAGSTGSGKSELLISLITGLAIAYDPTVLNFVLVDYKGGTAFDGFKKLPHCVDIVTNLKGDGVTRMFTAIDSEIRRRQELNNKTKTKDIVEYRRKGFHKQNPYPFLFIIIDEFAEMIADRAEFKSQLESITRVGRSLGVSLILAAQRPSGVTDQMRSNIKFRICLRVETPPESRELLRRTEAAFLPSGVPGRGYLQVGNEEIELIQLAYTGDKYIEQSQPKVIWPKRPSYKQGQEQEPPELYQAIVTLLNKMTQEHGLVKQHAPWPNFLPSHLTLSEPLISQDPGKKSITLEEYLAEIDKITLGYEPESTLTLNPAVNRWLNGENGWLDRLNWERYAMRPVVGLVDNPYKANQLPLTIELPRGHAVIFGASGWGKTTFLRSLAVSLMTTHSPDHLHVYILDLGGRNLGILEKFPHVGAVITPDEEGYKERVEQLLRELNELIEQRKNVLNNANIADLYQYNETYPNATLPAILVAIDNFIEFKETFEGSSDNVESVLDKFVTLTRESKRYGIHFAISVNQLTVLSNQLYSIFTERLTLKLADTSDYRAIVGGNVSNIGDVPGRGYIRIDNVPLSFQIAQAVDVASGQVVNDAQPATSSGGDLETIAQHMQDYMVGSGHAYKKPVRVDALPKAVLFKHILSQQFGLKLDDTFLNNLMARVDKNWQDSLKAELADWLKVNIGMASGKRLRQLHLEAKVDGVHGMIAGGTGSGKSELLMTLIVGLALNYDPTVLNFVLVDYKGGGAFAPFENALPHCVDVVTNRNESDVKRMFTAIKAEMQRRQKLNVDTGTKDIVAYRANGLHLTRAPYPHLFIIIDEYAEMITNNPEFKNELDSITRLGRAQGVHLLLASQRPMGVTDQMRENIKYRICLRVEGVDTSREMLRRADAAFLPSGMPGRGYLQIGNENIELVQTAYTGEDFTEWQNLPTAMKVALGAEREEGQKPKFYNMVIALTQTLFKREKQRTPWPPFLQPKLTLEFSILKAYLHPEYEHLVTLGQRSYVTQLANSGQISLNPFIKAWLDKKVAWQGIDWSCTAMRAIVGVVDNPFEACQLPLVVDVTKGNVVLFGASGSGKTSFIRTMITSLAVTHSPDEFQFHILDLGGHNLKTLEALPHSGTIIMPDEAGYEERVQQLLRELNDLVDERKRTFGTATLYEYNAHAEPVTPAILVVIDNFSEFIETFGDASGKSEDNLLGAVVSLMRQQAYGLHFLVSIHRLNALSGKLYSLFTERFTLRLSDPTDYNAIVGGQVSAIGEIPGRGYVKIGRQPLEFQAAISGGQFNEQGQLQGEAAQIQQIGQYMKDLGQDSWSGQEPLRIGALPKGSSYRQVLAELFKISPEKNFLSELKVAMRERWSVSGSAEQSDWLKATLGIMSGNKKRELHLSAKKDGVHGMIAGGTGAGKSELLMTLIVGLVINHSPDILNFVLVDYKGGGAFKPFEKLPHCVDIVTNLNKAAVARMFTSINAEIRRRQKLNADTGTKDIVEYRQKGYHLQSKDGLPGVAYPHLFIIIDEYAEMIDNNPEYLAELESITRVGRAQGINLVLASQRPKHVTDQMRANIKLRLCLRVEEADASREMLRRADAAFLPNGIAGRGYLQVGNDNLELIQVSYTGENQPDEREAAVIWTTRPSRQVKPASEDIPKLFDAVVKLTAELVNQQMAPKPWPSFLPTNFTLSSMLYDAQKNCKFTLTTAVTNWLNNDGGTDFWPGVDWRTEAMCPIVGLVDDPAEACQKALTFNLGRTHLVVFGDSGMGKTSFLRSMVVSLAATHSPNEFHVYILDLGGHNFRSLEELPHVGAVIYADEETYEERLQRLLDKLERMVEERQQILSNADANTLFEYNERHPDKIMPAVVVIIDNFAELQENYEMLVESTVMPLVRRSLSMGISFVVSGNVPNNLSSKLYNLFAERITFKQTNTDRYMDIVGRGAIEIEDLPGRGYIRVGRRPLMFQMALAVSSSETRSEADELRLLAKHMNEYLADSVITHRPERIETLPEIVSLREMLAKAPVATQRHQSVLGQDSSLQPALFNLKLLGPHFAVVGPPLSGKTTTLYNWVLSLAYRYPPTQVKLVLLDLQRKFSEYGGQNKLSDLPHVVMDIGEVEQLENLVTCLKSEAETLTQSSSHEIFIVMDNFDDLADEVSSTRDNKVRDAARDLVRWIRQYGTRGVHLIAAGSFSVASDVGRIIQASNYGIGLRTADALNTLRVSKVPASLRGKELAVGRGFIAKAGQLTTIQIATPYQSEQQVVSENQNDGEKSAAVALDKWVKEIQAKYHGQKATWSSASATGQPATETSPTSAPSKQLTKMMALLQKIMLQEMSQADGTKELLTHKLVQLEPKNWHDEKALTELLRELYIKQQVASGFSKEMAEDFSASMDVASLLLTLESSI